MSHLARNLHVSEDFPPVSTAAWDAAIQVDLKGADYDKKLLWKSDEGISVRPYFRREDIKDLESQIESIPGTFPFVRGRGSQSWKQVESPGEIPVDAIRIDAIHDRGGTIVQELGYGIALGVEKLMERLQAGNSVDEAPKSIRFVFAIGSNYFFEIAKLRAARSLWARAVWAFGPQDELSCLMKIHACTALSDKSIYDPFANVLRATTEAMAAVVGGCDFLEIRPFCFADRLAVNIQRLLREESHLDSVADPAGGSYYVEWLTDALAHKGWELFQQVEAEGGYTKAGASIESALAQSRAAKEKAFSSRRSTLVGVNNYPDLKETSAKPIETATGIWRAASAFERIRLRTEAYTRERGKRPKVLLLERGDLTMRQARSQFSQNFFGCAGFEIEISHEHQHSDADLIVLCSSDPEYLALAEEVCPNVRQPVVVAGDPKAQLDQLKAAGVQGFIHIRTDATTALTEWQQRLGIGEQTASHGNHNQTEFH
ncbi:MAG: methylmalonyl-CoA mutase family protein [Chthoniobacterales bacterium]